VIVLTGNCNPAIIISNNFESMDDHLKFARADLNRDSGVEKSAVNDFLSNMVVMLKGLEHLPLFFVKLNYREK
jgi:hypothetical protein